MPEATMAAAALPLRGRGAVWEGVSIMASEVKAGLILHAALQVAPPALAPMGELIRIQYNKRKTILRGS